MTAEEAVLAARYVVNAGGEKTDVLVPISAWTTLLSEWKRLIEIVEDQEDAAIVREFLAKRAAGELDTISLDELEEELRADGLLPG